MSTFLGKPLAEEQLTQLREHLKIDTFSKNASANFEIGKKVGMMHEDQGDFVRKGLRFDFPLSLLLGFYITAFLCSKGKTGDWKNHISPELNLRLDAWIKKNLAGTDLEFVTELEHQD